MAKGLFAVAGALFLAAGAAAQTAPQWGQCGGQGWAGATVCPSGWVCTFSNTYYSQCLQGAATQAPPPPPPGGSSVSASKTSIAVGPSIVTSAAAGATPTLITGMSFIRAVEDPNFHQYLRSEVKGTPGPAVLGAPVDSAQFQIVNGQLQQTLGGSQWLYAVVEPRANSTVMKLAVSWSSTPATEGSFTWSGDTVEWTDPNISRPQSNAWLVCPDAAGNKLLYVNLGPYDYNTPAGCADETIHAYTGPYPTS